MRAPLKPRTVSGVILFALAYSPLLAQYNSTLALAQTPQNTTTLYEYDIRGNLTKVTDPLWQTTKFSYDALSRRISTTDYKNGITKYEYDLLDQLSQVKDARNVITSYTIDGLGNLSQTTSADTGSTMNTYDEAGNLSSSTDAKLQKTLYQYDVLNRMTLITYADGATVSVQYDLGDNAIGRVSSITDSSGSITCAYDPFGRVASETRSIGGTNFVTSYRYDVAGRFSGLSYPSGRRVDYGRDATGRVTQITTTQAGSTTVLVNQVIYQPFGQAQAITLGNNRVQTRSFDLDGRLTTFSLAAQTMAVSYDAASRITGIVDAANATNGNMYGYDTLDRLTNVVTPTTTQSYVYDAVGNRTQKLIGASTTNYTYAGPGNRLTAVGAQTMVTDANGSITNKGGGAINYDARGRMVSANTAIGLVQYTINGLGQRVRKTTPTATTIFHYDAGGKLIAETTTTGALVTTQEYVYLGDIPVAVLR
jgi:YD repeat-containing protein